MKKEIVESYTEENYTIEELVNKTFELSKEARKNSFCVELIMQKPLLDKNGKQVFIV